MQNKEITHDASSSNDVNAMTEWQCENNTTTWKYTEISKVMLKTLEGKFQFLMFSMNFWMVTFGK